jgi:hypothetical protein
MSGRLQPGDADYRPARQYSWEPFSPGHELSLKHGAWSPRKVEPLASENVDGVLALAEEHQELAYLAQPQYAHALWSWGQAEARVQLLTEYLLDVGGDLDAEGNVRPASELLLRCQKRADAMRQRLGLDPLSRARLGRDVAATSIDVARMMATHDNTKGDDCEG